MKNITLKNRQGIRTTLFTLFKKEKRKLAALHYIFVTDKRLLEINRQFLQHNDYTDIITFPMSEPGQPVTAEIYMSVDRVRENAREFGVPLHHELLRVIFHGALHLCGHGDKTPKEEKNMRKLEEKYLLLHDRST
ncbi:MAG TPA: rRNA maturation RNase YbeY [Mucilaginibacter sp.]|nr:rRNA maturation RNase YbeY [Mucilaginibacter sp.]